MRHPTPPKFRGGFTLIEVMISLAIVLLLILAISNIFSQASKTVGAGFAVSNGLRAQRSVGQSLRNDIEGYDPAGTVPALKTSGLTDMSAADSETPFLVISNSRVSAFTSKPDQDADRDYNATDTPLLRDSETRSFDTDGSGTETAFAPAIYNSRSHRTDLITFFAKGAFSRQTGNLGSYVGDVPSINRAMITWGHPTLPDAAGTTFYGPGEDVASTNIDQFFANQFVLARNAVLLAAPLDDDSNATTAERIVNLSNVKQDAYAWPQPGMIDPTDSDTSPPDTTSTPVLMTGANDMLRPLTWDSRGWRTAPEATRLLQESRFDLAELKPDGTADLSDYRNRVKARIANPFPNWWQGLMGVPKQTGIATAHRYQAGLSANVTTLNTASANVAPTTPVVARGVTQCIVEFAGDFITQNQTPGATTLGKITAAEPDDVLDFTVTNTGGNQVRGIRWYGLPRDVDGDGIISGAATLLVPKTLILGQSRDVVPVRDVLSVIPPVKQAAFECGTMATSLRIRQDYASLTVGTAATDGMDAADTYTCVWSPNEMIANMSSTPKTPGRPKLIRILVTLTDEAGRLPTGMTQEYVFRVD